MNSNSRVSTRLPCHTEKENGRSTHVFEDIVRMSVSNRVKRAQSALANALDLYMQWSQKSSYADFLLTKTPERLIAMPVQTLGAT